MQRDVDHPGWDEAWPTPTSRQIDDLGELGLLRVDPVASNYPPRTFELSTVGRRTAKSLRDDEPASPVPPTSPVPAPSSLEVLAWLGSLDAPTRALGATVLQAAIVRFDPSHLEGISIKIIDLGDDGLIRFLDPKARLTGWSASTRLGKANNFRLTLDGEQRLATAPAGTTTITIGSVGQFAAGDFINVTLTKNSLTLPWLDWMLKTSTETPAREPVASSSSPKRAAWTSSSPP